MRVATRRPRLPRGAPRTRGHQRLPAAQFTHLVTRRANSSGRGLARAEVVRARGGWGGRRAGTRLRPWEGLGARCHNNAPHAVHRRGRGRQSRPRTRERCATGAACRGPCRGGCPLLGGAPTPSPDVQIQGPHFTRQARRRCGCCTGMGGAACLSSCSSSSEATKGSGSKLGHDREAHTIAACTRGSAYSVRSTACSMCASVTLMPPTVPTGMSQTCCSRVERSLMLLIVSSAPATSPMQRAL